MLIYQEKYPLLVCNSKCHFDLEISTSNYALICLNVALRVLPHDCSTTLITISIYEYFNWLKGSFYFSTIFNAEDGPIEVETFIYHLGRYS